MKKGSSQNINTFLQIFQERRCHLNTSQLCFTPADIFWNYCSEKQQWTIQSNPVFSFRLRAGQSCSEPWTGWHQTLALTTTYSRSPSPTVTGMEISIQNRSVTSTTHSALSLSKHVAEQLHHVCLWTENPYRQAKTNKNAYLYTSNAFFWLHQQSEGQKHEAGLQRTTFVLWVQEQQKCLETDHQPLKPRVCFSRLAWKVIHIECVVNKAACF